MLDDLVDCPAQLGGFCAGAEVLAQMCEECDVEMFMVMPRQDAG